MSRELIDVEIEDELRENTHKAIETIAERLDIPKSVYSDKLPEVFFDLIANTSFFNGGDNSIRYAGHNVLPEAKRNGFAVFEEAGHSLQSIINQNNERKYIPYTKKDLFFEDVLQEAFGYFCSRLSTEKRGERHLDEWEQDLEKYRKVAKILNNEDEIRQKNNVLQIGQFMYKLINIYLEDHPDAEVTDSLSFSMDKLAYLARSFSENVKPGDCSSYKELFHCMGYDLGADLYNHFNSNPQSGISLVNDVLISQREDSLRVFLQVYNALRSLEN